METALRCDNLCKVFGPNTKIGPVSFEVKPGEVFGLLGPDGAGKTTTLRTLCGILEATEGQATVLGYDVRRDPEAIKQRIGYMSQRFSLYGDLTVAENIAFFADVFQVSTRERPERTERLLAASRLTPFQNRLAQNLSGGMKQKLALVCTLIHTPQLLCLDEPTTGVDPVSRRDFWQILYGLVSEGMTLIVSTPYMDEAERCHRIALMNKGRILLCDTPQAIRAQMPGAVIELQTSHSWEALHALLGQPGIRGAEAFGERLHVVVDDAARQPEISGVLAQKGIQVQSARVVSPGLEDVFIMLMQENDHAGVPSHRVSPP